MSLYILITLVFFFFIFCFLFFVSLSGFSLFFFDWSFGSLKFYFYFNSVLFSIILLIVTISVLVFSLYYLSSEINFYYYFFVLLIFVGSMMGVNCSNSGLTMLISWDLLGISSFFLVLFYNNWDSCSGAMNTVLTNRVGDFFIFVFFSSLVFSGFYFITGYWIGLMLFIVLLLAGFTKSAQFPFSAWLPKAMSAPTPVSSLVHSSTLVTAGLVLIINYEEVLFNYKLCLVLVGGGLFTMIFSSLLALVEEDLKKVVALSTLSQMGFATLVVGLGISFVAFVHLVSHALFKSCLFMQVGYMIHTSFGQQDGRGYNIGGVVPDFIQLQMLVTLFCLCGLLFLSGAVSKDFILELFFSDSHYFIFCVMFFVSIFLTFGYSFRLWKGIFMGFGGASRCTVSSLVMSWSSCLLVMLSAGFLWWLGVNFLYIPVVLLYLDFFIPVMFWGIALFIIIFNIKCLLSELVWSFFNHYLSKVFPRGLYEMKFLDQVLFKSNMSGMMILLNVFRNSGSFLVSFGYSGLVLLIVLLFLFL